MITEKEYLDALTTVEAYKAQQEAERLKYLTPIRTWTESVNLYGYRDKRGNTHGSVGTRLFNVLWGKKRSGEPYFVFVEDITRDQFLKVRNAGTLTWDYFVKLRGY